MLFVKLVVGFVPCPFRVVLHRKEFSKSKDFLFDDGFLVGLAAAPLQFLLPSKAFHVIQGAGSIISM